MTSGTGTAEVTVAARFCGPARSGNGGYTAGSLARLVPTNATLPVFEVTLRRPPPLDVAMQVRGSSPTLLSYDGSSIAEAQECDTDLTPVEPVSVAAAGEAMARFPGLVAHPFPTCFVCGTARAVGDGLRIFPGQVGEDRVASIWVPHESLAEDREDGMVRVGVGTAWAALDCVGGWAGDMGERKMVLGRMTAQIDELPAVGETHVVVGQGLSTDGRKTYSASTLYDSDGRVIGRAAHTWIAVNPDAFN